MCSISKAWNRNAEDSSNLEYTRSHSGLKIIMETAKMMNATQVITKLDSALWQSFVTRLSNVAVTNVQFSRLSTSGKTVKTPDTADA